MEACLADTLCDLPFSRVAELDRLLSSYRVFRITYRYDPVAFIHDCISWPDGMGPAPYQDEILDTLVEKKRVCVRSPHGAGKTTCAALAMLWFSLTRDVDGDWKLPATASAWRQLSKYLMPELRLWARRLQWEKIGRDPFCSRTEMLSLSLKLQTGEVFAVASDIPDRIEGSHAPSMAIVYDEAKAIPDVTWDALEGAFSTAGDDTGKEAYALAISTPGSSRGRFYEINQRKPGYEDWHVRHVTLAEAVAAGRISAEWAEQRRQQWKEHSAVYQTRVLGEFAAADADGIIPLSWVEAANERWLEWQDAGFPGRFTGVGLDVGGGGSMSDPSVLALAYDGVKVRELRREPKVDPNTVTMDLAGHVAGILAAHGGVGVIDLIGIGAGTYHRLVEMGENVLPFGASFGTALRDVSGELGFANWRAAGWWLLREMLDPGSGIPICLPPDDLLTSDLTTPTRREASHGAIQIESKDSLRKAGRLGRSPDSADAVIHILVGPLLCEERDAGETVTVEYDPVRIGVDW